MALSKHWFNILKAMFGVENKGSIDIALEAKRKIVLVFHAFPLYTYNGLYFTDIVSTRSMESHEEIILTTRQVFYIALFLYPG